MPSVRSAPKLLFFSADFFRILVRPFQIGCDLPQLLLLVRSQIAFEVLGITADQKYAGVDHNIDVDDSRAPTFSFALRRPSQLPRSTGPGDHGPYIRVIGQVGREGLDSLGSD